MACTGLEHVELDTAFRLALAFRQSIELQTCALKMETETEGHLNFVEWVLMTLTNVSEAFMPVVEKYPLAAAAVSALLAFRLKLDRKRAREVQRSVQETGGFEEWYELLWLYVAAVLLLLVRLTSLMLLVLALAEVFGLATKGR